MKTFLKVPFVERFEAKRLGALWDGTRGVWFVADGVDLRPFLKWVPGLSKEWGGRVEEPVAVVELSRRQMRRKARLERVFHPELAPTDDELLMMIERDFIPDEEACITANPDGVSTYYERVDGGPWKRRY